MDVNQFKSFYKTNGFLSFASPTKGFAACGPRRSLKQTLIDVRPKLSFHRKTAQDLLHRAMQAPITAN